MTATDADTGAQKWQFKAPFPLMSGVTPTAGGLIFFGDMGGNLYAYDSTSGRQLWSTNLGGAIAGGVITYDAGAGQRVAVTAGMTSPIWPTPKIPGKVVVLGLQSEGRASKAARRGEVKSTTQFTKALSIELVISSPSQSRRLGHLWDTPKVTLRDIE